MDQSQNSANLFNKLADLYQEKFMDVSLYGATFDVFCKNITKKNAEVLELACGPGNITKYLLNKRPDLKILGTDLAPRMIELAKKNNPTAHFEIMDSRAISQLNKKYDAIMCGFCLPYLSKEEAIQLIHDARSILNTNGLIYISTMEDDHSKSGYKKSSTGDELFMYYHESKYLSHALEVNNFKLLDLQRIVYPASDGTLITDLIIIAKKIKHD
jgi:2-polyprenyl-3-methyl-5-hydroxy-6-metoxy-1,4-benzoquinol methylase